MRELGAAVGLRSFYFGDEAIVDVRKFSLEGRPIRKVRQSVTRLNKAGYTAEFARVKDVDPRTRAEVRAVSQRDLGDEPERGFSMCMDEVCGAQHPDSALVIARDGEGAVRGFLHLVPTYGRRAMSLSAMRRDRDTPNGLMEFLICHGIESTRAQGVEELSLNFAAFARWLHSPRNRRERFFGRTVHRLDRFFQIVSLYKFNAKFFPVWEPRYLLYQGRFGMLPTGISALILEGQVPRPPLRRAPVGWQGAEPEPARSDSDSVLAHAA
jgi:lysyl-tRNA synthetase class 2